MNLSVWWWVDDNPLSATLAATASQTIRQRTIIINIVLRRHHRTEEHYCLSIQRVVVRTAEMRELSSYREQRVVGWIVGGRGVDCGQRGKTTRTSTVLCHPCAGRLGLSEWNVIQYGHWLRSTTENKRSGFSEVRTVFLGFNARWSDRPTERGRERMRRDKCVEIWNVGGGRLLQAPDSWRCVLYFYRMVLDGDARPAIWTNLTWSAHRMVWTI